MVDPVDPRPPYSKPDDEETDVPAWIETLEPHARAYGLLVNSVHHMTDDELDEFIEACAWPTATNCGANAYRVAHLLLPEAEGEWRLRERIKAARG